MTRTQQADLAAVLLLVLAAVLFAALSFGRGLILSFEQWQALVTIFLSVFLEALPFVLAGVIVSSVIHVWLSPAYIARLLPKGRIASHLAAGLTGLIFPVCECGIIPVVRGLLRKGLPVSVGLVLILATPLVNPVVAVSTYIAFGRQPGIVLWRLGLGYLIAVGVGLAFSRSRTGRVWRTSPVPEPGLLEAAASLEGEDGHTDDRLRSFLSHLGTEFFEIIRFLVLGAILAAVVQISFSRSGFAELAHGSFLAVPAMMFFAFTLSVCSEADAFIAASLRTILPSIPLMAFMVFGPMLDLKNAFMLGATFDRRLVLKIIFGVCLVNLIVFSLLTLCTGGGLP